MKAYEALNRTILLCRDYVSPDLTDEEISHCFQSLRVLCVSDLRNISSHSGQTALITLVSLLSRMGVRVWLHIPEVQMLSPQPPLSGLTVRGALMASSEAMVPGATVCSDPDVRPDLTFVLGDTKVECDGPVWRMSGSDWDGTLTMDGSAPIRAWMTEWPIGSMVSASLAASETFKFVMRRLPLRQTSDLVFFEASRSCYWTFGAIPVPQGEVFLNEVDVISAGAICQAALYVLLRVPNVTLRGRIFDDDLTGASNLNRNMLSMISDIGLRKVHVVAQRCGSKVRLEPFPSRFECNASYGRWLARRVLVGVDDIPARWEAQRCTSGWLAVSGTSHFSVSSSAHSPIQPCCGCLHPVDDAATPNLIPTVSFVSFWAGLTMAVRLLREALDTPYSSDRQHLWLTPLRMDGPHAAMWLPVASRRDCPVGCIASRQLLAGQQSTGGRPV